MHLCPSSTLLAPRGSGPGQALARGLRLDPALARLRLVSSTCLRTRPTWAHSGPDCDGNPSTRSSGSSPSSRPYCARPPPAAEQTPRKAARRLAAGVIPLP
jgi:hypothetical protein